MPDTPPIAPALTDNEWAAALHREDFSYFALTEDVSDHARAALCLYGQPFGFTSEDVALLRDLARGVQATILLSSKPSEWPTNFGEDERAAVERIADRLAALLPRYECRTGGCGDDDCCGTYAEMVPEPAGEFVKLADVRALFTGEDVALLERLHRSHDLTDRDTAGWLDVSLSREEAERLRSLAARHAALLPRS